MSIPSVMDAVRINSYGGPDVIQYRTDEPVPELKDGHVLVRNDYAGVNYIDVYFRTGLYPKPLPLTLGEEGAGTVAAVHPSVTTVKPGDQVAYLSDSSYATYSLVPAEKLISIPSGVSTKVAAAVILQGLTALTFVREAGNVKRGDWVLVHAAAGGVGLLLVQILRSVGAKVIGTAGSDEKCAMAREHGAEWVLNSSAHDLVAKVNEITEGHGVDVIFDGVGKATFDADLEVAARSGTIVSFGNASGPVDPLNILRLKNKNLKICRPIVTVYIETREELEQYAKELFNMVISGKLNVKIHEVYPLQNASQAHVDIQSRKTTGKLLLQCLSASLSTR